MTCCVGVARMLNKSIPNAGGLGNWLLVFSEGPSPPSLAADVILSPVLANPTRRKTLLCKGFQLFRFGAGIATLLADEVARNGAQLRNFGQRSQKRPLHFPQTPPPALPRRQVPTLGHTTEPAFFRVRATGRFGVSSAAIMAGC